MLHLYVHACVPTYLYICVCILCELLLLLLLLTMIKAIMLLFHIHMEFFQMLEHALRTERSKNSGADVGPAPYTITDESLKKQGDADQQGNNVVKEGRQILLQYLSEMQYTDAVIEAQAQRVRGMLDSWSPPNVPAAGGYQRTGAQVAGSDDATSGNLLFDRKDSLPFTDNQEGDEDDEEEEGETIGDEDFDMGEYLEVEVLKCDLQ